MKNCFLILACLILGFAEPAFSQIGNVELLTVDGQKINGSIKSISETGQISGDSLPIGLNIASVIGLKTKAKPSKRTFPISVQTVSGGTIVGDSVLLAGESVSITSDKQKHSLSLESVRGIVWTNAAAVEDAIKNPSKENDRFIVINKGRDINLEGLLESITEDSVKLNYQGKSESIALEKIKAIITADVGLIKPKGSVATIGTADGSQWRGVIRNLDGDDFQLALTRENTITISAKTILSITIVSDRLVYLSDIEPVEVRERTDFTVLRKFRRDKSITGGPLTLQSSNSARPKIFNKGLGTQATSELAFANSDGFDRFRATVGIDTETKGRGDCQVIVRGDNIELWSKRIKAGTPPEEVDVDISGIEKITLVVYPGRDFDLADHLDWCNARFIKTKE